MTVETTTRKQSFAGGQSALTFTFKTLPDHPEHIKAKTVLTSTGVETDLTYTTQYTVSLNSDGVGGTVTISPSFSTLYTYTVYRDTTNKQESDYDDYNQFPADTLEEDLDRRTLIDQEQDEETDRTVKLPISSSLTDIELPEPSANQVIAWNAAADGLKNVSTTIIYVSAHQVVLKVIEDSDALNTGDGQISVTIPSLFNGLNLVEAHAHVYASSTSGTPTIQIRNVTDSADMLSTRITIDATETDSSTAAAQPVIDATKDDVATADVLAIDVDVAGTNTQGLEVRLKFA